MDTEQNNLNYWVSSGLLNKYFTCKNQQRDNYFLEVFIIQAIITKLLK